MSGSGGPLGFGEEPDRPESDPRRESDSRPEPDLWLPGSPAGGDEGPRRARSRLPGILLVGACFALLAVVGLNTLRTNGVSSRGPAVGTQIPPFAAPLVLSGVEGDVNLARRPGQGAAGARPACQVQQPGVITSCQLVGRRPAVIVFFVVGQQRCVDQLDVLAGALRAHPRVAGLAVAVRGNRTDLRSLVERRGWHFRVAQDRDGGMANVYGVAVCPQMTFVLPGGTVQESTVGSLDREALERQLGRLEARAPAGATGAGSAGASS